MGCTQSSNYYLGFINISISHLDALSFVARVLLTLLFQYLWSYCRHTRKDSCHILRTTAITPIASPPLTATLLPGTPFPSLHWSHL